MSILFYRYGSICEPAIINTFRNMNLDVIEETAEITNKNLAPSECVELVSKAILKHHPIFVFSINFYPAIAEVCHLLQTLYVCWTVDSPVLELFSKSIKHDTNRIFLFDKAQYDFFQKFNPERIFHLPLASDVDHFDTITSSISENDIKKFSSEISFVGSLYNEKNPLTGLQLSPYQQGYIAGLVEASLQVYGYNLISDSLPDSLANEIRSAASNFSPISDPITNPTHYIATHNYIGMQVAETERFRTLNKLAEHFAVDLYTRSNTSGLQNVHIHNGIKTLTEMPKAFHLSKINLNMTIKPIETGLPLRIFDIMGCGGFLMTNYQSEISDLFEIGVDLETYSSMEELIDKCAYYLSHEKERKQIAFNGYQKVKHLHSYPQRILEMLKTVISD